MSKPLVIVESPAKAKTISQFLGNDYIVEASVGHIRDLPSKGLSIDVDADFQTEYEVNPNKKDVIKRLKALLKDADELYLATDEDREGEAIAWHLKEVLKPKVRVRRIVFHEITEEAIKDALREAHEDVYENLVRAQESRRILDRLYGYTLSPVLWKKVQTGLSAGRVQSVAVRLIVEREEEIEAFKERAKTMVVEGHRQYNPGWHLALDLRNMLIVSECIAKAALAREESRGGHTRDDFPGPDDTWGTKNLVVNLNAAGTGVDLHEKALPEMPDELKGYFA